MGEPMSVPVPGDHCPFLNRADSRCAEHFRIDAMQHAFKYCVGRFRACPTYLQLRVERRMKQLESKREFGSRNVQVTISRRKPNPAAADSALPYPSCR
jgi:hypothetical protein